MKPFLKAIAYAMVLGLLPNLAFASNEPGFFARIFAADSNKQRLLFTYKQESVTKGDTRTVTNTFIDDKGKTAVLENIDFVKEGDREKVRSYRVSQKQLGAEGSIEVKDGKANFSYTVDGKTKTATESVDDSFVVGPSIMPHLRRHWREITSGEKVKIRLAVADRAETVGFEFSKDREETVGDKKAFVLKMKPSSFIIAAIVKPLFFFVTPDGETLLEVHGRTQVKQNVDGRWKDLDAVTVYETIPAGGNSK